MPIITVMLLIISLGLCVSTIVFAAQKSQLENDLQDAIHKLCIIPTMATPTTSESSSASTQTTFATEFSSTGSSEFPWPTMTVPDNPSYPTFPSNLTKPEEVLYRLPIGIKSIKYEWYFHPNIKENTCNGSVSIQIQVEVKTNLIVMQARKLD